MIRENGDMDISLSSILPEGIKTDLSLRIKHKYIPQKTDAATTYWLKPLGSLLEKPTINRKLNTTMNGKEVYLKHQIITIVNGTDLKPQKVVLGGDIGLSGYFSNMALYKLIGFYDELTPLQIEKVINDYKLKYN